MQANNVDNLNAVIAPGALNATINPHVVQGDLEFESSVNVLKMSLECVDNVAAEMIKNLASDSQVNILHLIRTVKCSFTEERDSDKVLSQYLIPIKGPVTDANAAMVNHADDDQHDYGRGANNMQPNWNRNEHPLPTLWTIVSNDKVIIGYKLNIGRLTFNQATTLLIGAPKFVLKSCVYVDRKNKVNRFSNLKEILGYFLHIRIPFYNRWLALSKAKEQNMSDLIKRYQQSIAANGNVAMNVNAAGNVMNQVQMPRVTVVQYSHMLSFSSIETDAFTEASSELTIGRVGLIRGNDDENVFGYSVGGTRQAPVFTWVSNKAAPALNRANGYYDGKPKTNFADVGDEDYAWCELNINTYGNLSAMDGTNGAAQNIGLDGKIGQADVTSRQIQSIWITLEVKGKLINDVPVRSFRV